MHVYLFYKKINVLKWIIARGRLIAILLFEGGKGGEYGSCVGNFLNPFTKFFCVRALLLRHENVCLIFLFFLLA